MASAGHLPPPAGVGSASRADAPRSRGPAGQPGRPRLAPPFENGVRNQQRNVVARGVRFHGVVRVPANKYWGAQTQRSLQNFKIGGEKMPMEMLRALAIVKHAAATVNETLGKLARELAEPIRVAAAR